MTKIELIRSLKAMQTTALQQELALFGIPRAASLTRESLGERADPDGDLQLMGKVRNAQVHVRNQINALEELLEEVTVQAARGSL